MTHRKHIVSDHATEYREYKIPNGIIVCVTPRRVFEKALAEATMPLRRDPKS